MVITVIYKRDDPKVNKDNGEGISSVINEWSARLRVKIFSDFSPTSSGANREWSAHKHTKISTLVSMKQ